jgi:hypothetical protein
MIAATNPYNYNHTNYLWFPLRVCCSRGRYMPGQDLLEQTQYAFAITTATIAALLKRIVRLITFNYSKEKKNKHQACCCCYFCTLRLNTFLFSSLMF